MEGFFSSEKVGDVNVIRLFFNEINLEQKEELKKELAGAVASDEKKFILDFTKVGFISSLVIATVIFFSKEVKESGGAVKLSGLSKEGLGVFQITHLDKAFELYGTEQEALESF